MISPDVDASCRDEDPRRWSAMASLPCARYPHGKTLLMKIGKAEEQYPVSYIAFKTYAVQAAQIYGKLGEKAIESKRQKRILLVLLRYFVGCRDCRKHKHLWSSNYQWFWIKKQDHARKLAGFDVRRHLS